MLPTVDWTDAGVVMIDQRKLPGAEVYVKCKNAAEVAKAIKTMVIRGAPAIGVSAAMGVALGMKKSKATGAGNKVMLIGSTTGRDGIHGATFASADLTEEAQERKSACRSRTTSPTSSRS